MLFGRLGVIKCSFDFEYFQFIMGSLEHSTIVSPEASVLLWFGGVFPQISLGKCCIMYFFLEKSTSGQSSGMENCSSYIIQGFLKMWTTEQFSDVVYLINIQQVLFFLIHTLEN